MSESFRAQRLPEGPSTSGMASSMRCLKTRTPGPRHPVCWRTTPRRPTSRPVLRNGKPLLPGLGSSW
jgi:hypothetical protein